MSIDQQLLSSIANLLSKDGCNYTVFLQSYAVPIESCEDSLTYIRKAMGEAVCVGGVNAINGAEAIKEIAVAISYAGDSGAGPSSATLESAAFVALLAELVSQLQVVVGTAKKIEQFWLSDGHPAYPVFWDFAYLFTCANEAHIFVGASSD